MNYIPSIIRIAHKEGADLAYFTDVNELYESLSGLKDDIDTRTEFIQKGDIIELNDKKLKVVDVYLRLQNIEPHITHEMKNKDNFSKNFNVQIEIFIEYP